MTTIRFAARNLSPSLIAAALALTVLAPPAWATTRILLTNDDGPTGPGLQALYTALAAIPDTEIEVVVPAENASGSGAGLTIFVPFTVTTGVPMFGGVDTATTVSSNRPVDCVRWAYQYFYAPGAPPHYVISGINQGQNVGAAFGSGTVGGALAGNDLGIKSIAISQGITFTPPLNTGSALADYDGGATFARNLLEALIAGDRKVRRLSKHLEKGGLLNIQIPPDPPLNARITRAGDNGPIFGAGFIDYGDNGGGVYTPNLDLTRVDVRDPIWAAQGIKNDIGALGLGYIAITLWTPANVGRRTSGKCCDHLLL